MGSNEKGCLAAPLQSLPRICIGVLVRNVRAWKFDLKVHERDGMTLQWIKALEAFHA